MSRKKKAEINLNYDTFFTTGLLLIFLKELQVSPVYEWSWWLITIPFYFPVLFLVVVAVFSFLNNQLEKESND